MPNIGQMVLMEPVWISQAQPAVTSSVASSAPGSQSVRANLGDTAPNASCSRKRAMRVPASMVVRMNRASNMMAKWYQYFRMPAIPPKGTAPFSSGGLSPLPPIPGGPRVARGQAAGGEEPRAAGRGARPASAAAQGFAADHALHVVELQVMWGVHVGLVERVLSFLDAQLGV